MSIPPRKQRAPRGSSERVPVPLSPEEAEAVKKAAADAHMEIGAWLREQIMKALDRK